MPPFAAHRLRFSLQATQPLELPKTRGSALRGALFESLWRRHCERKSAPTCTACPIAATCPVGLLIATLEPYTGNRAGLQPMPESGSHGGTSTCHMAAESPSSSTHAASRADRQGPSTGTLAHHPQTPETGHQLPRPYAIEPPLSVSGHYAAGQRLTFGLTLFAGVRDLVPYLIDAVQQWRTIGIGHRQPVLNEQRSRVQLLRAVAFNPFTDQRQVLWSPTERSRCSEAVPITPEQVAATARHWPLDEPSAVQLTFHTPTRLIARGRLVRSPQPRVLIARLLQRLDALGQAFSDGLPLPDTKLLLCHADALTLRADETRWVDQWSPSRRLRRTSPIGGFVGRAILEGDRGAMRALLPWLLWGSIVHVGKDTVKGNGWYQVGAPD